jgi:hypothetical protein
MASKLPSRFAGGGASLLVLGVLLAMMLLALRTLRATFSRHEVETGSRFYGNRQLG